MSGRQAANPLFKEIHKKYDEEVLDNAFDVKWEVQRIDDDKISENVNFKQPESEEEFRDNVLNIRLFALWINNDDNEPQIEIVKANNEKSALLNYLTEIFFLDFEEESEEYICSSLLKDGYYGVTEVKEGGLEFTFYNSLSELK